MCQPKPGPRCSAHARTALTNARDARDAAEAAHEAAKATLAAQPRRAGLHADERTEATDTYVATLEASRQAATAYDRSLREYETTPDGQRDLTAAIDRLAAAGAPAATIAAATDRLAVARATRERQTADLVTARAITERLRNLTEDERVALVAVDADMTTASAAHDQARAAAAAAQAHLDAHTDTYQAALAVQTAAIAEVNAAQRTVQRAAHDLRTPLRRLYVAAGVNDRYAGYYTDDCVENACRVSGDPLSGTETPRRPVTVKVKQRGADAPLTLTARRNAASDPAFTAANARLAAAIDAHTAAYQAEVNGPRQAFAAAMTEHQARTKAVEAAHRDLTEAHVRRDTAIDAANRTRAQIAAGAGLTADPVDLRTATDQIVRNPDGTTNAYAYRPPSPGFTHGRYLRVTGVQPTRGMTPANALVLEDGSTVQATETYSRGPRGGRTHRNDPIGIITTPPADGAAPLRAEGNPGAGFFAYTDTTD